MIDEPKPSQRSIIAFCDCAGVGHQSPAIWIKATTVRNPLTVSSLTSLTLKVNDGSEAILSAGVHDENASSQGIKVVVNGNAVDVYVYYFFNMNTYLPFGYDDRGSFMLTATTAGDVERGIEGCTRSFNITVLLLGKDWPYYEFGDKSQCLYLRVGKPVDLAFAPIGAAKQWYEDRANTGYGVHGTGPSPGVDTVSQQAIVSRVKINDQYAESGLTLFEGEWPESGNSHTPRTFYITGTAARPGVYRISLSPLTTVTDGSIGDGSPVITPFSGGEGETILTICIYAPYQIGNTVVLVDPPAQNLAKDAFRCIYVTISNDSYGYGQFLQGLVFTHYADYGNWSAMIFDYTSTQQWTTCYYFRAVLSGATWYLYGYYIEPSNNYPTPDLDTLAGMSLSELNARSRAHTTLATANARNFNDEQPPKQGWTGVASSIVFVGDLSRYIAQENNSSYGGWYNYAGYVIYVNDQQQTVQVPVYERSMHHVKPGAGWGTEVSSHAGIRYVIYLDRWYGTSSLGRLFTLPDTTGFISDPGVEPAHQAVALPFCPGKEGDFGVMVPTDNGDVFHSLSNQFATEHDLRILFDNLATSQWEFYPMRRLLSLYNTTATITLTATYTHTVTDTTSGGDGNGNSWSKYWAYRDGTGWSNAAYLGSRPSKEQVEAAPGQEIKVITAEYISNSHSSTSFTYSAEKTITLSYAVWDVRRLLAELSNVLHSTSGLSGSLSITNSADSSNEDTYTIYGLFTSVAGWGLGGGGGSYEETGYGEGGGDLHPSYKWVINIGFAAKLIENGGPLDIYFDGSGGETVWWTWTGSSWTDSQYYDYDNDGIWMGGPPGHPTFRFDQTANTVTLSWGDTAVDPWADADTQELPDSPEDGDTLTLSVSIQWSEPAGAGLYTTWSGTASVTLVYNGGTRVFEKEEKDARTTVTTDGPTTSTSTVSNPSTTARARVFFGDGRESTDEHRSIIVSANGHMEYSGVMSAPSAHQVPVTTTTKKTYQGKRTRPSPYDDWTYDPPTTPSGGTMVDNLWGSLFTTTDHSTADIAGEANKSCGGATSFTTALVDCLITALLAKVTITGETVNRFEEASCSGSYTLLSAIGEELDTVSWNKSGSKRSSKTLMPGLPEEGTEVVTGTDPDEISPDKSAPRESNVEAASWTTYREIESTTCNFTIEVQDTTGQPAE